MSVTTTRSAYVYSTQRVCSADGSFVVASDETGQSITSRRGERDGWTHARKGSAAKQLFASNDGRAAAIGADDVITFYDPSGTISAEVPLLEQVPEQACTLGTAGRSWDDYVAGTFTSRGPTHLVLDGRGCAPLVFDPRTGGRVELPLDEIRRLQRERAQPVLTEALPHLRAVERTSSVPWVLAAIGWARVAASVSDASSIPCIVALGELELSVHGTTTMSLLGVRCPDDPIYLDRYALDPLRQAVNAALLRLGTGSALVTMKVARRRGLLAMADWIDPVRPQSWLSHLDPTSELQAHATPSELVAALGTPMHVERGDDGFVWSYHHLGEGGARTTDVLWGRKGIASVSSGVLPLPTPRGLVA